MKSENEFPCGSLAVVATPLGNPGDVTARAARVLATADVIAAEDTRTAARFLAGLGIKAKLVSYHDWNEAERAEKLIERLAAGDRVALVSEAGTPCISDPGFDLVRAARARGFAVFPVPGPSALVAFLSVSGLPTNAFSFFGFPPAKSGRRKEYFKSLADRTETLVFYESPHRFRDALEDALLAFGDREAAMGREMTKTFEEFYTGTITGLISLAGRGDRVRGEVTWGVAGRGDEASVAEPGEMEEELRKAAGSGRPLKELSKELSNRLPLTSKEIYSRLQRLINHP